MQKILQFSIMTTTTSVVLLSALFAVFVGGQWVNDYDQDARLECRGNEVLSFIGSVHNNHHEDRKWQFQCKPYQGTITGCRWSGFINNFDSELLYNCPGNQILNGKHSYHNNRAEDRRFEFMCCDVVNKSTNNCGFTGFINDWDRVMHYSVPEGRYIKGVYSVHSNRAEDRRWKINLCNLS